MGSSMSAAKVLYSCAEVCWRALRSTVSRFQDTRKPPAIRAIGGSESVFRGILDTEGNIVYGTDSISLHAKATADKTTLLRRLLRGPAVDVFVGPERIQFSVPKGLFFHYSTVAQTTFQHRDGKHFQEFAENVLNLPEHAPETFEFLLKWMYQGKTEILEYCQAVFESSNRGKESVEAALLLLCRVYILADYLDVGGIMVSVMDELREIRMPAVDQGFSAIGPEVIKTVFWNTHEGSQLQKFILSEFTQRLVYNTNSRPIEDYHECFTEIEGFGPMIVNSLLEYQANAQADPSW